jgi:hypothetical protein
MTKTDKWRELKKELQKYNIDADYYNEYLHISWKDLKKCLLK